jgi:hypothetical protein
MDIKNNEGEVSEDSGPQPGDTADNPMDLEDFLKTI